MKQAYYRLRKLQDYDIDLDKMRYSLVLDVWPFTVEGKELSFQLDDALLFAIDYSPEKDDIKEVSLKLFAEPALTDFDLMQEIAVNPFTARVGQSISFKQEAFHATHGS